METQSACRASGALALAVTGADGRERPILALVPDHPARELSVAELLIHGLPQLGLPEEVNRWRRANVRNLYRGARRVLAARAMGIGHIYGQLWLTLNRADGSQVDLGLASMRVVTTAGANAIAGAFRNNAPELELFNYHALGTGTNAEASGDTALQTELTTEYTTNNVRPTGTQAQGATANVYRSTGSIGVDASVAATEHGVLTQAAVGGGTLLDRSVFAVVNLASGESLTTQYDLTIPAGG